MDADDISLPDRIKKQVDFMRTNPDTGIAGTYVEVFGKNITKKRVMKHPVNRALNKIQLLFCPCLAHPSVIMRKSVIDKHGLIYESSYKHAEDYAFWINAIAVTEISNIPEVLLKYRVLPSSVTQQANKDFNVRFAVHKLIYTVYFRRLNLSLDDDELLLHFIVSNNERFVNHGKKIVPESIKRHLKKLYVACKYSCLFDNDCTAYYLNKRGLSLSRWYSKNKYDSLYYLIRFLYYRLKIIAK
jgi:hypothetical protein